jgi:putative transposase
MGRALVCGVSDQLPSDRGNDGERGVEVDHSTLHRWVLKYVPALEKAFLARKRPVGGSWRLDETYVRVKGAWKYLYRAVDKAGATVDFLLTARRDRKAALRFLRKAIGHHNVPETITIDKSGANTAAIVSYNADHDADVEIREVKYLNNIVEQDHRAIKRRVRAMLGFKAFWSTAISAVSEAVFTFGWRVLVAGCSGGLP